MNLNKIFSKIVGEINMYCSQCGKEIADDSKFCQECGYPVTEAKEQQEIKKEVAQNT